ncbi:TMEM165/GDT1 family protein [Clostridium cochlearium]|uniref:TMEM165/GDT1 family protein n=1 Tax=Clostridium cochlearium TaxID=1494 RepID=UPI001852DE06|nr:TMEM165/GDT1 family protein [Clostridium cochlearium]NMA58069.1 TMEM165/GDT1 family protein [Clostridium cochlearium]
MIKELIRAFLLIFVAEMGDKTQIIAMTFATQYKIKEVLMGVFLGVFLNHGLAIILGSYISKIVPMDYIQIIAGFMFVVFGILSLRDEETEDENHKRNFGPIFTVALAFFVGELGDKTQLTAMTLATEGNYPFFILIGTTLGMIGTSAIGIFIGGKIGEKIPDVLIKFVSSLVFIFFGTIKLYNWIPKELLKVSYIIIYFVVILLIEIISMRELLFIRKHIGISPIKEAAANLYIQTQMLNKAVENICLGEEKCGSCSKNSCIIGYTKEILKDARENEEYYIDKKVDFNKFLKKNFDKNKVIEALALIIRDYIEYGVVEDENFIINEVRRSFELILFGTNIKFDKNPLKYLENIEKVDKSIGKKLKDGINL